MSFNWKSWNMILVSDSISVFWLQCNHGILKCKKRTTAMRNGCLDHLRYRRFRHTQLSCIVLKFLNIRRSMSVSEWPITKTLHTVCNYQLNFRRTKFTCCCRNGIAINLFYSTVALERANKTLANWISFWLSIVIYSNAHFTNPWLHVNSPFGPFKFKYINSRMNC